MDTIVRLAGPLPPSDRDVYLREVAAALDGREEIGDGFVARVCAEVQRRLWHSAAPPSLEHGRHEEMRPPGLEAELGQGLARPGEARR